MLFPLILLFYPIRVNIEPSCVKLHFFFKNYLLIKGKLTRPHKSNQGRDTSRRSAVGHKHEPVRSLVHFYGYILEAALQIIPKGLLEEVYITTTCLRAYYLVLCSIYLETSLNLFTSVTLIII